MTTRSPTPLRCHPRARLEQVLPLLLQRFEPLAREPGCRGYGARVAFVADLAQGVADEAQRVGGVERFVERVFHVEAKIDELRRGALGRRQGFTGTLEAIQRALEKAGIEFIDGNKPGVPVK
jgi:hypothetical protein